MPTRDDYERLLMHGINPGERVRILMENQQEYNSQRMIFYRLLENLRAKGYHFPYIQTKKRIFNEKIYFVIEHLFEDDPVFEIEKRDGTIEKKVLPRDLAISEDNEFETWLKGVRNVKELKDDNDA